MPTLQELEQEVNSILDYNPDLEAYRKQVRRHINRHYLEISGRFPWLFLQKAEDIQLYAPVEGSSSETIVQDGTNTRKVLGTGTAFFAGMAGHNLKVGDAERRVVYVESATVLYIETAFDAGEIASSTSGWSMKFTVYDLPEDMGDVLGFMDRENRWGRIPFMTMRQEERYFLENDVEGGTPAIAIEKPAQYTRSPAGNFAGSGVTDGGSSLPIGTYEYLYTITEFGQESAPSKTIEVTLTGTNDQADLTGLDDPDFSTGNWTGRVRKIYRRSQTSGSRFFLIAEQTGASLGTTYSDDGSTTITYDTECFEEKGIRQRFRIWFQPANNQPIEVRYQAIPKRMQSDGDQPEWPKQYHLLLVYLALVDAGMQHGMLGFANLYEGRASDMLKNMRSRWLTRQNNEFVRKGFDREMGRWIDARRYGDPIKS